MRQISSKADARGKIHKVSAKCEMVASHVFLIKDNLTIKITYWIHLPKIDKILIDKYIFFNIKIYFLLGS